MGLSCWLKPKTPHMLKGSRFKFGVILAMNRSTSIQVDVSSVQESKNPLL